MPVKVVDHIEEPLVPGSQNGVPFEQLKEMVKGFQNQPKGSGSSVRNQIETTKFVHFQLQNILELLIVNGIASDKDTIGDLKQKAEFGLKVYFAQHMSTDDCPLGGEDYVGRNTVVLVTTRKIENSGKRMDMLKSKPGEENYIETTGFNIVNQGEGLDKTNLCPPQSTDLPEAF